jgi:hypothetical protein
MNRSLMTLVALVLGLTLFGTAEAGRPRLPASHRPAIRPVTVARHPVRGGRAALPLPKVKGRVYHKKAKSGGPGPGGMGPHPVPISVPVVRATLVPLQLPWISGFDGADGLGPDGTGTSAPPGGPTGKGPKGRNTSGGHDSGDDPLGKEFGRLPLPYIWRAQGAAPTSAPTQSTTVGR